jgi:hypothetical protein
MSTSTEQGKKVGVFSCQNLRVIWLDRPMQELVVPVSNRYQYVASPVQELQD